MPLAHNGSNEGSSPFGLTFKVFLTRSLNLQIQGIDSKNILFSEYAEIGSQAFVK